MFRLPFSKPGAQDLTTRTPQELFVLLVPATVIFAMTVFGNALAVDGDPFFHIAAGQWMIDHTAFIRSDFYSQTMTGTPLHPHEWLFEVVVAAVYALAGWGGLHVLLGLAFAATTLVLARALLRYLDPVPALYVLLFVLIVLKGWVTLRPHVAAMPILALFTEELLLARHQGRPPRLWLVIALMVVWVNLHGSFLFGIALMGPFAGEAVLEAKDKLRVAIRWGASILAVTAAALLNPSGIDGLLFPLRFSLSGANAHFPDWQGLVLAEDRPTEIAFLVVLAATLLLGVRLAPIRLVVLIGMLYVTFEHRRFVAVLAIVGAILLAEPLARAIAKHEWSASPARKKNPRAAAAAALAASLVMATYAVTRPMALKESSLAPITALSRIPTDLTSLPVFNELTMGGYLVFTGHRVFVDGRADVYGADFLSTYDRIIGQDREALESTFAEYNIAWTILSPSTGTVAVLDQLPGWCRFYADAFAVVHVKDCKISAP